MASSILEQLLAGRSAGQQIAGGMGPALPTGGAPQGTPAAWSPAPSPKEDPLAVLLQGSARYQQQNGQDPLAAAAARGHLGNSGAFGSGQPVPTQAVNEQAVGLNRVAQITSHGPREGQAHTTFDLPGGLKANVYYDAKGRRKTFVYHP